MNLRERVFILCKRKDLGELPEKPEIKSSFKKETDLSDIMDESNNKYKIDLSLINLKSLL